MIFDCCPSGFFHIMVMNTLKHAWTPKTPFFIISLYDIDTLKVNTVQRFFLFHCGRIAVEHFLLCIFDVTVECCIDFDHYAHMCSGGVCRRPHWAVETLCNKNNSGDSILFKYAQEHMIRFGSCSCHKQILKHSPSLLIC